MGCAVSLFSHDLHGVMAASDRGLCRNGHVSCEGNPDVVADASKHRTLSGSARQGTLELHTHDHDHYYDHDDSDSCCIPQGKPH